MTGSVVALGPRLKRVIVLREAFSGQWSVEGYERHSGQWRFTWLLHPAEREPVARQYAAKLARHTGLPVGEQRLGARICLVGGILGKGA